MKIVLVTQEDHFVIPQNINKIIALDNITVELIVNIDSKGTLVNKKAFFIQGFGLLQSAKMGFRLVGHKLIERLDRMSGWRLLQEPKSVRAVAGHNAIRCRTTDNPNNDDVLQELRQLAPDLIVSFSAPCVFHPPLLSIPKNGCINLHCSFLPHYAGLLPSFWALFHNETETGTTIHYMDDRIDNGSILAQEKVAITKNTTMFELIRETKAVGGDLVCKVIKDIQSGHVTAIPNNANKDAYFSWPTVEQMRTFRRAGGRLI
ncbi:MAG: hypothetical protein D3915_02835 [Candidatus Electrothrix sp. AU1_5]|nr:hypothetical protein [Candidatus Electrothrix gigas]